MDRIMIKYICQGDLPSAVLLFEAAARQDPDSAEVWQLLGNVPSTKH